MSRAGRGSRKMNYLPSGSLRKTWPDCEDLPPDDDAGGDSSAAPVAPRGGGPIGGAEAAVAEEIHVSLTEDCVR